jgi:hypothetical protein
MKHSHAMSPTTMKQGKDALRRLESGHYSLLPKPSSLDLLATLRDTTHIYHSDIIGSASHGVGGLINSSRPYGRQKGHVSGEM